MVGFLSSLLIMGVFLVIAEDLSVFTSVSSHASHHRQTLDFTWQSGGPKILHCFYTRVHWLFIWIRYFKSHVFSLLFFLLLLCPPPMEKTGANVK